jgi:uncharacterized protein
MNPKTDTNHINEFAKKLLHEKYTMTLATADQNIAWAAPVYFVLDKTNFYFFSDPKSRHVREALAAGQAAAAIYEESSQWQNLRGIQMSGKVKRVPAGSQAGAAVRAYIRKFPLVASFFSENSKIDLSTISSRFHTKLYCFIPGLIYYMDNAISFGFREEIQIDALNI